MGVLYKLSQSLSGKCHKLKIAYQGKCDVIVLEGNLDHKMIEYHCKPVSVVSGLFNSAMVRLVVQIRELVGVHK